VSELFQRAVEEVLRYEGGYSYDPNDPGGETNWGISKAGHPEIDVKNLTREKAIAIYEKDYWLAAGCDQLPPIFAIPLFDGAVNHGVKLIIRKLQGALGVEVDGTVGPETIEAAHAASVNRPWEVLADFLARRAVLYARQAGFLRFGRGWMTRLFNLQRFVIEVVK